MLAAVNGVGDLISSVVVGLLWTKVSANSGFIYAAAFTFLGAVLIYFFTGKTSAPTRAAA